MKPIINPSLMCMDFLNIKEQLAFLNKRADIYHFDVMDGHYVPNITLSPDLARAMAPAVDLPFDFHMMVTDPALYLPLFAKACESMTERGIHSYYTPHAETINGSAFRLIDEIKKVGFQVGLAINPETPLDYIKAYMHKLDKLTFMSVDPGFAGQAFIPEVLDKVREAKQMKDENPERYHFILEMDGSCNANTFKLLADAGIESFVLGSSSLFKKDIPLEKTWEMTMDSFNKTVNG